MTSYSSGECRESGFGEVIRFSGRAIFARIARYLNIKIHTVLKELVMIEKIRNLYAPIQPTVKKSGNQVSYQEFLPQTELLPFIYCYWELKTIAKLDNPFTYRVVTDGCIDIFFELHHPDNSYVMGFCKKYTEFPLESPFHYIGVRFLPTTFSQIFNIDASFLSNRFQPLSHVSPATSRFIGDYFDRDITSQQIPFIFDQYFLDAVDEKNFVLDSRLYSAIDVILKKCGIVNLATEINTGISERQLRRLFKYYIGDTPKSFSKVVQFQNILKTKPSSQSLRRSKLFYDFGYYDQAHFIKDFKNFYGVTPSRAFGRE